MRSVLLTLLLSAAVPEDPPGVPLGPYNPGATPPPRVTLGPAWTYQDWIDAMAYGDLTGDYGAAAWIWLYLLQWYAPPAGA